MSSISNTDALENTPFVSEWSSIMGRVLNAMSGVLSRDRILHLAGELINIGTEALSEFDVSRTLDCTSEQMSEYAPHIRELGEGFARGAEILQRKAASDRQSLDLQREAKQLRRISSECAWLTDRLANGRHSIILSAEARETLSQLVDREDDDAKLQAGTESAA